MDINPYAGAARAYISAGWVGALPLPPRAKDSPPEGYTGKKYFNVDPTSDDIEQWIRRHASGNVALRMPRDILGIDVDAYDGKPGLESLAEAELQMGPLPATWSSSSRGDGPSRIRFYRVPEGLSWPNVVGPGIETIHRGHRYAVVWPSIHPEGRLYEWFNPDGVRAPLAIPRPSDLAILPRAWVEGLTASRSARDARRGAVAASVQGTMNDWLTDGEPCRFVDEKQAEAWIALDRAGSRHDSLRDLMLSILYLGQQGHSGVDSVLHSLRTAFVVSVAPDRKGGEAEAEDEWAAMLEGAASLVAQSPRPPEVCTGDASCRGAFPSLDLPVIVPQSEQVVEVERLIVAEEDRVFWNLRPELAHIKAFARARFVSPWAVLGCALVHVVAHVPPRFVLPPIVGGEASLNLFVALVGASGSGKGASEAVAREAIKFTGGDPIPEMGLGSGEGIVQSFVKWHPPKRDEPGRFETVAESVIFRASEVDTLSALRSRQGSTLIPLIRDAWIGDSLGFAYSAAEKRASVTPHTYRMGVIIGVQELRAGPLVDDVDGGTPQRFVWMATEDPSIPDDPDPAPERLPWSAPPVFANARAFGNVHMEVCEQARTTIKQAMILRNRGAANTRELTEQLDGHALLSRLKVAAALALFNGRTSVTDDDWALSAIVMDRSNRTRAQILRKIREDAASKNEARGKAEGKRAAVAAAVVEDTQLETVKKRALTILAASSEPMTVGDIKNKVNARLRSLVEDALTDLEVAGQATSTATSTRGGRGRGVKWSVVSPNAN